jgi:hypothetical protein
MSKHSTTPNSLGRKIERRKVERHGGGLLLNGGELAKELGESERTILTWRQRGILPVIDCGYRSKRYRLADVFAALKTREIQAIGASPLRNRSQKM